MLGKDIFEAVMHTAAEADALCIGEIHGTHEIPLLIAGLMPALFDVGYRAFGVEVPAGETHALQQQLITPDKPVPMFYAQPWPDGRGSYEMLELCRTSARAGIGVFCFDQGFSRGTATWAERDAAMARHILSCWKQTGLTTKIALICGNNHAFLRPHPQLQDELWPSCAHQLSALMPDKAVRSIEVMPARGQFYNYGVQTLESAGEILAEPQLAVSETCSLRIVIPTSTPATFMQPPAPPSQRVMLSMFIEQIKGNLRAKVRRT